MLNKEVFIESVDHLTRFEIYSEIVPNLNKFLDNDKEIIDYIHWFVPDDNALKIQIDYRDEDGSIVQSLFVLDRKGADLIDVPVLPKD